MRIIVLYNLDQTHPEFAVITDWLSENVTTESMFIINTQDEADADNSNTFVHFARVEDASAFVTFLYDQFPDFLVFGSLNKERTWQVIDKVLAVSGQKLQNIGYPLLHMSAACYAMAEHPFDQELLEYVINSSVQE